MAHDTSYNRLAVAAWSLFDFANSAFTTLVVTFIYATYFTQAIASDEIVGAELWSRAIAAGAVGVALLSPFLGAVADRGGLRKRFLAASAVVCVGCTAALYWVQPGQVGAALALFVAANIAFELAEVFYNAYLPEIAPPEHIGRVSGMGWATGYLGGMLCLGLALVLFVYPEAPAFGFSKEAGQNIRATNLLVAAWFALFSLPLFLVLRERRPAVRPPFGAIVAGAGRQLAGTFRDIRRHRQIFRLLLARLVYNDGIVTIFAFGGIYAAGTFGFSFQDIMIFGIALNVAAGAGAYAFGFLDDRLGGKRTILITLAGLALAVAVAVAAPSAGWFWAAGLLVGLLAGPNQSASRSLLGRMLPERHKNEFYGFFSFSGKATAFLGPVLLGLATRAFASQRAGVAVVIGFFLVGAWLLGRVDEQQGIEAAQRAESPDASIL